MRASLAAPLLRGPCPSRVPPQRSSACTSASALGLDPVWVDTDDEGSTIRQESTWINRARRGAGSAESSRPACGGTKRRSRPAVGQEARAATEKTARCQNAPIVFDNESGVSLLPSVRATWAPRGQTPGLRHRFNWKPLSLACALAYEPGGSDAHHIFNLRPGAYNDAIKVVPEQGLPSISRAPLRSRLPAASVHSERLASACLVLASANWVALAKGHQNDRSRSL